MAEGDFMRISFSFVISVINILFVITAIYSERKKPMEIGMWILIMTFLPVGGFVLYLFFGRGLRFSKKKRFKIKKEYDDDYNSQIIAQKNLLRNKEFLLEDKNSQSYYDIIEMHINESNSILTDDNDIDIFINGTDKYTALIKDIEEAKETIHLLYFIIKDDVIGEKIVSLLTQKAREGVEVRFLYDHLGSYFTPAGMFNDLIKAGGKVNRFFPLKFGTYLRANYRNHRKVVVIDGKIGYLGGMNIGDEYMGRGKNKMIWRDTHLRITGSAVYMLQTRIMQDWYYSSDANDMGDELLGEKLFPTINSKGKIAMQIVSSGPDASGQQIKRGFIKMINCAKESIYIQTPYFIPDETFLESLQIAAMSGKDIRVMIPGVPDKKMVYRVTFSYIQELLDYGIKVYIYPGFLHSKMVVIDEEVSSIGTTNMDIRSFKLDFEVNAFIYNSKFSLKCAKIFENDMKISELVTMEWYKSRSIWNKFQEGFFRLFSGLL